MMSRRGLSSSVLLLGLCIGAANGAYKEEAAMRIAKLARTVAGRQELLMESHHLHTELVEDASIAKEEQQNQGQGFKIKFDPKNSSVFDALKSSTFKVIPNQVSKLLFWYLC